MKKRDFKEGFRKVIIMIFLVLLLAIIYLIVNNVTSIRKEFLAIPLDWVICIVIGIIVKTIADYFAKKKRKKSGTSTKN
ncbi:MAG: hypothetical protein HFJ40_03130 [Clostridia bacterium]|nr:hypothetical protein [Clostridia bacterium]